MHESKDKSKYFATKWSHFYGNKALSTLGLISSLESQNKKVIHTVNTELQHNKRVFYSRNFKISNCFLTYFGSLAIQKYLSKLIFQNSNYF